jgi:hypothetical protein
VPPAVVKGRHARVVSYPRPLARANGVRVLEELPPANGRRVGFLEAPNGGQIEVIEKVP